MFENYVTGLVLRYGRKFIQDLPDLKLSVWGGDVELRNLQVRLDVIERIFPGVGIQLQQGIVRHLRLHIPWTSLTSSPIEVHIDTLELFAVYDPVAAAAAASQAEKTRAAEAKQDEAEERAESKQTSQEAGWGAWVITKIRNNVSLNIENLVVRIQFGDHVITMSLDSLECFSANHLWEQAVVEPGDTGFLRKLCNVEGAQFRIDPCDAQGRVIVPAAPVVAKLNLTVRAAMFAERSKPNLPENRLDVLCSSSLIVNVDNKQLQAVIGLAGVLKKSRGSKAHKKAKKKTLLASQSAPVVMQNEQQAQGWVSWMWGGGAAQPAAVPAQSIRRPSVTAVSVFLTNCNINLNHSDVSGSLLGVRAKNGGCEVLLGDGEIDGPMLSLGCEVIRVTEGSTGVSMLEARAPQTSNGIAAFFESGASLPFSLFDKRQTVAFAQGITDAGQLRELVEHEIAFGRYTDGHALHSIAEQQQTKWKCYDAVFFAYEAAGEPQPETYPGATRVTTRSPSCITLSLHPSVVLLSFPTLRALPKFFSPGKKGESNKQAAADASEPAAIPDLATLWATSPPLQVNVLVGPCRVYLPLHRETAVPGSPLGGSSVSMSFVEHKGISFSNRMSFPPKEISLTQLDRFSQNRWVLSFRSVHVGIAHRSSVVSSKLFEKYLTCKPLNCHIEFGKSVLKTEPTSMLLVKVSSLDFSCHRLDLSLVASCLPADVTSPSSAAAAVEYLQYVAEGGKEVGGSPLDLLCGRLQSVEIASRGSGHAKVYSTHVGHGSVVCGSTSLDDPSVSPLYHRSDVQGSECSFSLTIPKAGSSSPPSAKITIHNCEVHLVAAVATHWLGSLRAKPSAESPLAPPSTELPPAPRQSSIDKFLGTWESFRRSTVSVSIKKLLLRASHRLGDGDSFCVFLPVLTASTTGVTTDGVSVDATLEDLQCFSEQIALDGDVGHTTIVRSVSGKLSLTSRSNFHVAGELDLKTARATITLDQLEGIAAIVKKIRSLQKERPPSISKERAVAVDSSDHASVLRFVQQFDLSLKCAIAPVELSLEKHLLRVGAITVSCKRATKALSPRSRGSGPAEGLFGTTFVLALHSLELSKLREPGGMEEPLALTNWHLLSGGAAALSPNDPPLSAPLPFLHLTWQAQVSEQDDGGIVLGHSLTAKVSTCHIFPWWPSLLDLARTVGLAAVAFAARKAASRASAVPPSPDLLPFPAQSMVRQTFQLHLRAADLRVMLPGHLNTDSGALLLFNAPSVTIDVDGLIEEDVLLPTVTARTEGLMIFAGDVTMGPSTPSLPLATDDFPKWLAPQFAGPVHLRISTAASGEVRVTLSPVNVRMSTENLATATGSFVCAGKCSTAIRKLALYSAASTKPSKPRSRAKPSLFGSVTLVLDVPDVQVQLLGRAGDPEARSILLSRIVGLGLTASGDLSSIEGAVDDIYVRSVSNNRVSEVLGRTSGAGAGGRQFVSVVTAGSSVVVTLCPFLIALDATLLKEHIQLFQVPDWGSEVLLSFDGDIKRKQAAHKALESSGSQHRRRKSSMTFQLPPTQPPKKAKNSESLVVKLIIPECSLTNAVTLLPHEECERDNAVLRTMVHDVFLFYARDQEHLSLSFGAMQFGISQALDKLQPVLQPPLSCHLSVTQELHDVTSALPKRALNAAAAVPLVNASISLGQMKSLATLGLAYVDALALPGKEPAAKGRDRARSLVGSVTDGLPIVSSGDLLREGFSVNGERDSRPFVNQITLSSEADTGVGASPWMSWQYCEPRSVRSLSVRPFPAVPPDVTECTFQLQYFDIVQQAMVALCSFTVDLLTGNMLRVSGSRGSADVTVVDGQSAVVLDEQLQSISASEWKLVAFSLPCSPSVFPLACSISTFFLLSYSYRLRCSFSIQCLRVSLTHLIARPDTQGINDTPDVPAVESLFTCMGSDLQTSAVIWRDGRLRVGYQGTLGVQYVESQFLTTHWALEPTLLHVSVTKAGTRQDVSFFSTAACRVNVSPSLVAAASAVAQEASAFFKPTSTKKAVTDGGDAEAFKLPQRQLAISGARKSLNHHLLLINSSDLSVALCQMNGSSAVGSHMVVGAACEQWTSFSVLSSPKLSLAVVSSKGDDEEPPALLWSSPFSLAVGWQKVTLVVSGREADCWLKVQSLAGAAMSVEVVGSLVLLNRLPVDLLVRVPSLDGVRPASVIGVPAASKSLGDDNRLVGLFVSADTELQCTSLAGRTKRWVDLAPDSQSSSRTVRIPLDAATDESSLSLPALVTHDPHHVPVVYLTPLVRIVNSSGLPLVARAEEKEDILPLGQGKPSQPESGVVLAASDSSKLTSLFLRHTEEGDWHEVAGLFGPEHLLRYKVSVDELVRGRRDQDARGEGPPLEKVAAPGPDHEPSLHVFLHKTATLQLQKHTDSEVRVRVSLCVDMDAAAIPPELLVIISLPYRVTNLTPLPIFTLEQSAGGILRCADPQSSEPLQWSSYDNGVTCHPPAEPVQLRFGVSDSGSAAISDNDDETSTTAVYDRLKASVVWSDLAKEIRDGSSPMQLLRIGSKDLFVPLAVTVLRKHRSTEVVVSAYHVAMNETEHTLVLRTGPGKEIILPPGSVTHLAGPWTSSLALVQLAESASGPLRWTKQFRLGYVTSEAEGRGRLLLPVGLEGAQAFSLVTYQAVRKDNAMCTVFYRDSQPPVSLINRTKSVTVRCTPVDRQGTPLPDAALRLFPGTTSEFSGEALFNLKQVSSLPTERPHQAAMQLHMFESHDGFTDVVKGPLALSMDKRGTFDVPLLAEGEVLSVSIVHAGSSTFVVFADKDETEAEEVEKKTTTLSCSFHELSVCLVAPSPAADTLPTTRVWDEMLLVTLNRVTGKLSAKVYLDAYSRIEMSSTSAHCTIGDLQVDNMQRMCEFPVICHPVKPGSIQPALDLVAVFGKAGSASYLQCLSVQLSSMDVKVEDTFLYALRDVIRSLLPSGSSGVSPPPASVDVLMSPAALKKLQLPPLYVESLHIAHLDLRLSVRLNAGLFLSLDHTPVELKPFNITNQAWVSSRLARHLTEVYVQETIFRAPAIIGSLELMGNPTNLVRDYVTAVQELIQHPLEGALAGPTAFARGVGSGFSGFLRFTSRGTLTSLSGMTSSVARNLDKLSLDPEHQSYRQSERMHQTENSAVTSSFFRGIKGFSFGVVSGVSGVVSQPVYGAYEQGFSGFFSGVGRGIMGAVTKPVGGALELISYTSQGVLETVTKRTVRRRSPRTHLSYTGSYGLALYSLQWVRQCRSSGIVHGVPLFSCLCTQASAESFLLVTSTALYVVQQRGLRTVIEGNSADSPMVGIGVLALEEVVCIRQAEGSAKVLVEALTERTGRISLELTVEGVTQCKFLVALVSALSRTS